MRRANLAGDDANEIEDARRLLPLCTINHFLENYVKKIAALTVGLLLLSANASAKLDAYPPAIAEQLSQLRAAENGAVEKLNGTEARYLFSRKRWAPGSTVLVAFRGGTPQLHKAIADQAALWTRVAHINLDFGLDKKKSTYRAWTTDDKERIAHIRIGFSEPGYWSYVGTDSVASFATPNSPSMNFEGFDSAWPQLDARWKAVVIHEFGHALGLHHEHQHPVCEKEFRWEPGPSSDPSVYEVFAQWQGWSRQVVDVNLRPVALNGLDASPFPDKTSIMFYAMPAQSFKAGSSSSCFIPKENVSISKIDALGAQRAYPKSPTQAVEVAFAYAQAVAVLAQQATSSSLLGEAERAAVQSRIDSGISAKRPLLYIQIQREDDRRRAEALQSAARKSGFLAPGIENVSKKGTKPVKKTEIRFFRPVDSASAENVAATLRMLGEGDIRVVQVKSLAATVTRNLVEVWFP